MSCKGTCVRHKAKKESIRGYYVSGQKRSKHLDPLLIDMSYYVASDSKKGNDKAYYLLVKILDETKKMEMGKLV